jgi:hypothetical protein
MLDTLAHVVEIERDRAYPALVAPIGIGVEFVHSYMRRSRWNTSNDALEKVAVTDAVAAVCRPRLGYIYLTSPPGSNNRSSRRLW